MWLFVLYFKDEQPLFLQHRKKKSGGVYYVFNNVLYRKRYFKKRVS